MLATERSIVETEGFCTAICRSIHSSSSLRRSVTERPDLETERGHRIPVIRANSHELDTGQSPLSTADVGVDPPFGSMAVASTYLDVVCARLVQAFATRPGRAAFRGSQVFHSGWYRPANGVRVLADQPRTRPSSSA